MKKNQAHNDISCIQMNNPEVDVVINTSDKPQVILINILEQGFSITVESLQMTLTMYSCVNNSLKGQLWMDKLTYQFKRV